MALRVFPRTSVTLPTGGAVLREPYARGLVAAFAPGVGNCGLTDLVSGLSLTPANSAALGTGGGTAGLVCATTNASASIVCPAWLKLAPPLTVVTRVAFVGTPATDSNLFGVMYSSPVASPYVAYDVGIDASGYFRVCWNNPGFQTLGGTQLPVVGVPLTIVGLFTTGGVTLYYDAGERALQFSFTAATPIYSATSRLTIGDDARNANLCLEYGLIYNRRLAPDELKLFRDNPYHWLRPAAAQQFALGGVPAAGAGPSAQAFVWGPL